MAGLVRDALAKAGSDAAAMSVKPAPKLWSESESSKLLKLKAEGKSWNAIALTLGRSKPSCRMYFLYITGNKR